jgi:methyl coenzyme M reductase gamma subunit
MHPTEETKRKIRDVSEHELKKCLGHVTNTNGFSKRFKPASIKRFGEDIIH